MRLHTFVTAGLLTACGTTTPSDDPWDTDTTSGGQVDDTDTDTADTDATPADTDDDTDAACVPVEETCNGEDDDCDGRIDNAPTAGSLIITEWFPGNWDDVSDNNQWIEVHSLAEVDVLLCDDFGIEAIDHAPDTPVSTVGRLAAPLKLEPGEYAALGRSEEVRVEPESTPTFYTMDAVYSLANIYRIDGELRIVQGNTTLDSIRWDETNESSMFQLGASTGVCPDAYSSAGTSDPSNWQSFYNSPTPGSTNACD